MWVMEQQSGPVNGPTRIRFPGPAWSDLDLGSLRPRRRTGVVFPLARCPTPRSSCSSGLHTPDDRIGQGHRAAQVAAEIARLPAAPPTAQARVALVFDYRSKWILDIQPHGADFSYYGLVFQLVQRLAAAVSTSTSSRPRLISAAMRWSSCRPWR